LTYRTHEEDRLDGVEGFDVEEVDKVSIEEYRECTLYKYSQQTSDWFILEKKHMRIMTTETTGLVLYTAQCE